MKIIKVLSKKVKEKDYYKYIVTLPKEAVEKSRLEGKQIKAEAEKNKICLVKEKN
ncbi:MAG: hypothetical protein WC812_02685 [Candidatus Pacearchaeota archaeon]|jgi:hypothetical protein